MPEQGDKPLTLTPLASLGIEYAPRITNGEK